MTPIRRLPSVLGARRPNTLDQERENMERMQEASYRKAINDEEAPVKMKHVRKLIIASHEEKGSQHFWKLAHSLHPLSGDVTAWKFCHTLHMLLRDGHKNVMRDAMKNFDFIKNIREHFHHLNHGYGRLIVRYTDLLLCKLRFHQHNPQFPSNLSVKPDELHSIAETDANNYFELAVEMFEYTECILNLYNAVFSSLDQSRANSNTRMGQCRLAPLIPCIQDSTSLYDLTVRIMFNLHKDPCMFSRHRSNPSLTVDLLTGHRDRFKQQFPLLHAFYANTANLQYFKLLNITIPQLPKDPPNFLVEAELQSHVAPVVVLQPEADDTADAISDTASSTLMDMALVDTSSEPPPPPIPPHPHPDVVDSHNGSLAEGMAQQESLMEAMSQEVERQRSQLQLERSQHQYQQQRLAASVHELQANVAHLESALMAERAAKESILVQVEAAAAGAEAVTRLQQEEAARRIAEEKFAKMREVYQKLRDEHVSLIRAKAEVDRSADTERCSRESLESTVKRLEERLAGQERLVQGLRDTTGKEQQSLLDRLSQLQESLDTARGQAEQQAALSRREVEQQVVACVAAAAEGGVQVVRRAKQLASSPQHADLTSTPEFTLCYEPVILESLSALPSTWSQYLSSSGGSSTAGPALLQLLARLAHNTGSFVLYATAASRVCTDVDKATELLAVLDRISSTTFDLLAALQQQQAPDLHAAALTDLIASASSLVSQCVDASSPPEDASSALEREMAAMREAIEQATQATAAMLQQARTQDTGLKLEVNESLLATCMELLDAVQLLVVRAAALQQEVVQAGKGGASSPKDFYKRNQRWTQGLISGAKAVAVACQTLMTATDAVVCKDGSLEEVMVSSREIAASSMQLVMASRVKAEPGSEALGSLNQAAKAISTITGNLVATAESFRDKVSQVDLDFSQLSLHQAKRLEMDTLVKVIGAEKNLEVQREKLAQLRRHHYQMAAEGAEQANSSDPA